MIQDPEGSRIERKDREARGKENGDKAEVTWAAIPQATALPPSRGRN